jgi:hypothetical protein
MNEMQEEEYELPRKRRQVYDDINTPYNEGGEEEDER